MAEPVSLLRDAATREQSSLWKDVSTGSYTNKDGQRVYTTDVVAENVEFAESKNASAGNNDGGYQNAGFGGGNNAPAPSGAGDGFMNIPDGIDEELPFN